MQQDNFFNNKVTKRVKDVIIYSKEEAARLGNDSIAPEHVLLGIFRDGEGPAMAAFEELNVDPRVIRQKIEDDPRSPKRILTVWGVGYRYESV